MRRSRPVEERYQFAWDRPPLTANQRMHWHKKANITRDVRTVAHLHGLHFPKSERVEVTLRWVVKDKRRRDADNLVPTLKALCDGLVDAGIVPDDTPEYMVKHMPVIVYDPFQRQHLELIITQLPKGNPS